MFDMTQTLIVVYKDEMLLNQFKKLVETKDDNDNEIVGIKDGSVKIVAWNQKTWYDQKKAGNITSKVLFIGDVKGTDKLIPVLDSKYDEFGVKFGWAGNQAVIYTDSKDMNDETYSKFLGELNKLSIPEALKGDKKAHFEVKKVNFLDKMAKGIQGVFDNRSAINQQKLIYGIFKFYYLGLKDFVEA